MTRRCFPRRINWLSSSRAAAFAVAGSLALVGCMGAVEPPNTAVVGPTGRAVDERPLYCYRTLAGADCFAERIDAPPNRLIRGYEPVASEPQSIVD